MDPEYQRIDNIIIKICYDNQYFKFHFPFSIKEKH